jgi:hypothetical protein
MSETPRAGDDAGIHPLSKRLLFLDSPGFKRRMLWVLLVLVLIVTALGFVIESHDDHKFWFEKQFKPFHAVFGFVAFSFAVICGWPLRRLLGRPEDYYSASDDDV